MRIGIDARLYRSSIAGIGRYSQNLIKNLLEIDSGNQFVLFMTSDDAEEFRMQNTEYKINKEQTGNYKFSVNGQRSTVNIIITDIPHYSIAEQTKFAKIIEKEKLDLMHFLNFNFPVNYKGKFVVTIHDLTLFFYPGRQKKSIIHRIGYKYIFGQACKKAKKIIAVSDSTKKDIIKTFGTAKSKIEVVYEAANDKTFAKPSSELIKSLEEKYKINEPIVLYVGQWRPHKNLVGLIKAFNLLRKDLPCRLALVGKVDQAYPEILENIDKLFGLRDTNTLSDYPVIMPGFVGEEELAAWYKIASVFVFPSFYEGFGLPGLESMMAGTPVVSSNRTSLPEIYENAAVYFDPSDLEDMKEKLKEVITNEEIRKNLIEKGGKVAQKYSWRKAAQETLEIYNKIKG